VDAQEHDNGEEPIDLLDGDIIPALKDDWGLGLGLSLGSQLQVRSTVCLTPNEVLDLRGQKEIDVVCWPIGIVGPAGLERELREFNVDSLSLPVRSINTADVWSMTSSCSTARTWWAAARAAGTATIIELLMPSLIIG
jgi:hypothetical protein